MKNEETIAEYIKRKAQSLQFWCEGGEGNATDWSSEFIEKGDKDE